MSGRDDVDLVEFAALNDLFCYLMTNSEPGQQFLSVTRYKGHVYTVVARGDREAVLFTKEAPQARVYVCEEDSYDFAPAEKPRRSRLNIRILELAQDTLADSLFPDKGPGRGHQTSRTR